MYGNKERFKKKKKNKVPFARLQVQEQWGPLLPSGARRPTSCKSVLMLPSAGPHLTLCVLGLGHSKEVRLHLEKAGLLSEIELGYGAFERS